MPVSNSIRRLAGEVYLSSLHEHPSLESSSFVLLASIALRRKEGWAFVSKLQPARGRFVGGVRNDVRCFSAYVNELTAETQGLTEMAEECPGR